MDKTFPESRWVCSQNFIFCTKKSRGFATLIAGIGFGIEVRQNEYTFHFKNSFADIIRKTFPCNEYPLIPHFLIVKLGFAGVYLFFFLLLLQNIDYGYSLEPPRRGGSNVNPQSMF